jgi:N-acetylglucosaminyldiphosphoundecaprenol N-acetyl-beta-D-mannosaminyltransferase
MITTKRNLLGVFVDAVDQDEAADRIIAAALDRRPLSVSALAVHGLMEGVRDRSHRFRLNDLDVVTPDGQAVRWGLNLLHRDGLRDRVYGPDLMRELCRRAAADHLGVFLYGSSEATLQALEEALLVQYPGLVICGTSPSVFGTVSQQEAATLATRITGTRPRIVFVGLGCPRQEVFAYEFATRLGVPTIAVGAAFDYLAGTTPEPPAWVGRLGLQWLVRLAQEPRRLWRRYALNPVYLGLLLAQYLNIWRPRVEIGKAPWVGWA